MLISRVSTRFSELLLTAPHASACTRTTRAFSCRAWTSSRPTAIVQSTLQLRARAIPIAATPPLAYQNRPIFPRHKSFSSATSTMGSLPEASHAVRVLVLGGCYAGLSAVVNLLDLSQGLTPRMNADTPYVHHPDLPRFDIEITVVDERDGYYHLIGSPLALADTEYSKKNWVKFSDCAGLQDPSVKVIQGSVKSVDLEAKTATVSAHLTEQITTHHYDYLVSATGLRRVWPVVPQSLTRKQYLVEAEQHIRAVDNAKHGVVVVGGGAVGIEMAAELKMVKPHVKVTLVHSRDKLLSSEGLPDETKDRALELVLEGGVEALMNHRLASTKKLETADGSPKYEVEFTNGHKMVASEVIMAISKSVPTSTYLPASALEEEGYVKIKPNLMFEDGVPNAEYHFAAGDIAKWSGIKRCGGAMHQGHYVAMNIHQSIISHRTGQAPKYHELNHFPAVIGLAVGKKAVASSPDSGTISGEDVAHAYFRDDLGWSICWNWLQLGGRKVDEAKV